MAAEKRNVTQLGIGAVRVRTPGRASKSPDTEQAQLVSGTHGRVINDAGVTDADEAKPLAMRDTLPAPPSVPACAGAKESGAHRHDTIDMGLVRRDSSGGLALRASAAPLAPPPSAPPEGRYSSQPAEPDVALPGAPRRAGKETLRRAERQALRVDEVGPTSIVARRDASLSIKPLVIDRQRLSEAPLAPREAFLLSFADGALTVPDLVDASGMPEHEVMAVLTRLEHLGILSLSS